MHTAHRYEKNNTAFIAVNCNNNQSVTLISADVLEWLESALAHAYDVIEINVPNKKNFQFGVMGL